MTHLTLAYLHDLEGGKPSTNDVPKGPSSLQMALKGKYNATDTTSSGRGNGSGKKKKKIKSHKDKEDYGEKKKTPRRKTQHNKVSKAHQSGNNTTSPVDRTRVSPPHYYDTSSQHRPQPKQRATAMKMSFTIGEDVDDHTSNDRVLTIGEDSDDRNCNDFSAKHRSTVSSVDRSATSSLDKPLVNHQENATEKRSRETTNSSNSTSNFCSTSNRFEEEAFESFAQDNSRFAARDGMEGQQRKRKRRGAKKKNRNDDFSLETNLDSNAVDKEMDFSVPELEDEDVMAVDSTELVQLEMGSRKNEEHELKDSSGKTDVQHQRKHRGKKETKDGSYQEENAIVAMAPSSDNVVTDSDMSALELQMNAFESKIHAMMERREQDLKVIEELRMTQEENRTEIRMLQLAREGDRNFIQELQEAHEKDHAAICDMRNAIKSSERQQLLFMTSALNNLSRVFKRR